MKSLCILIYALLPPPFHTGDEGLDCMLWLQTLEAASREDRITTCCLPGFIVREDWPGRSRAEISYVGIEDY